jgi:hypothetical protein
MTTFKEGGFLSSIKQSDNGEIITEAEMENEIKK